jgi:cytochrome c-type biogenesis protein CcmH
MNVTRRMSGTDAILLLAVVAVILSVAVAALSSRERKLDDRARSIDAQLRCPTCQGLSIADSPATSASQMRDLVRAQLADGASDDKVRAFFVARYGRWILLDPPASGPDLVLWLAPALMIAVGALLVVRRARVATAGGRAVRWGAAAAPAPRLSTIVLGAFMVLALAAPIVAAVGPRLVGREVSGRTVAQATPSIDQLEAFVRAAPRDVEALLTLADALLEANRDAEAAERYAAALEFEPDNVHALLGVAGIFLGAGRPDAAGPLFDRVLALSPDQPDALLYRAVARFQVEGGTTDPVRRDLRRFLDVTSPDDPRRAMASDLLEQASSPLPDAKGPTVTGSPTP